MVGGCSAVNFATYNKPSKEDIDSLQMNTKCFPTGRTDKYSLGDIRKGSEGWNWDRFNIYMERAVM